MPAVHVAAQQGGEGAPGRAARAHATQSRRQPSRRLRDPGMTTDEKARAFDRFWRARSGDDGSGLGLAIARRLVELDGGAIELRDAPGSGLDAIVRLPHD
jgi:K+-sensing histidine kinase KdpD